MKQQQLPAIILTGALAFVFGYFGLDKFLSPLIWIGWIPPWMEGFLGGTSNMWLHVFGVMEIAIAVLLLLPKKSIRLIAAALASAQMAGVITQTGWGYTAARDGVILASALALFFLLRSE